MEDKESICDSFQQMVLSLMEEESIGDVEPPMLVEDLDEQENGDELFTFILEYFGAPDEIDFAKTSDETTLPNSSDHFSSEAEFLAKMDDMLAMVNDDNMDDLADLVVDWVL